MLQVKWVSSSSSGAKHILSTNDKTIKLWKVRGLHSFFCYTVILLNNTCY